ncbi:response regulator transcription factor [Pedobacter faecalis]|uniref:response regulator transcription factor n=1 Tax=Pedobacter faecalis TaxID=3041495 RepID=UPI00254EB066|nr:response regulator transcription factor [Pedobacter sp. ELA7]
MYDIVLIEDEPDLGTVVSSFLKMRGFSVIWFQTANEALGYYRKHVMANRLLIIDVQLPDMNGFDLAARVQELNQHQIFLFLTAHSEKGNRLRGLNLGAIDYISKPFEIDELVLRVSNILKTFSPAPPDHGEADRQQTDFGDLTYYHDQLLVLLPGGREVSLTRRESELLNYLIKHPNRVVRKSDVLMALWGSDDYFNGKSLEVFISRLRGFFKASELVSIENVYGLGYILKIKKAGNDHSDTFPTI